MAVDELLLRQAAERGQVTLRFYQWAEPTLSLGYFQRHLDRQQHVASQTLPMVRRASGGGALVHHHELTYSLALPATHPLAREAEQLYFAVHETLVELLHERGHGDATLRLCPQKEAEEPFLCFQRRAQGDVLLKSQGDHHGVAEQVAVEEVKICGSAQRRNRGAVLQHGGVLLARSASAPELTGLAEGWGEITAEQLQAAWSERLAHKLKLRLASPASFADGGSVAEAAQVQQTKFGNPQWCCRR